MAIPGNANLLLLQSAAAAPTEYAIERSLRFNSSDSAWLSRNFSSDGNRTTWTLTGWVKRSTISTSQVLFAGGTTAWNNSYLAFASDDYIGFECYTGSGIGGKLETSAIYRDPSAWYHIVAVWDSSNSTSGDRIRLYVNGERVTQFRSATYPSLGQLSHDINFAAAHGIGANASGAAPFNGYLADVHFIDGQALDPTSFGEFDADTGIWNPKAYTGTYGTNGFHLDFSDNSSAAALGYDAAGSNDWTVNNISVASGAGNDSLIDVPTNGTETDSGLGAEVRGNYCTWNPLDNGGVTLSNGNLDTSFSTTARAVLATFGMSSGKWYWEGTVTSSGSNHAGIAKAAVSKTTYPGGDANGWSHGLNGFKYNSGSGVVYGSSFSVNDVIGVAFDADNGTLIFYKNGVSEGTAYTGLTSGPYFPIAGTNGLGSGPTLCMAYNFGQRPFAYTAPSGFKALCTANLPAPTVEDGSDYMDVVTYTGTGSSRSITGLGFSPDLAWIKVRSVADHHILYDAVRGAQKQIYSNLTNAEETETQGLTSFNSDGFSLGGNHTVRGQTNESGKTYVAWTWDAGSSTVSNTDGSITSSVRANPTAGFSIVTWTGVGGTSTVGHGLGVAPAFWIIKPRSAANNWNTYHSSLATNYMVWLNLTNAATSYTMGSSSVAPTSTVVTVKGDSNGWDNRSGDTYVMYAFAPVEGYSAFGSYTGNGSTDGPFVFTGMRPRWVLIKRTDTTAIWNVRDSARDTYNYANKLIYPNSSQVENAALTNWTDLVSNGFKPRNTNIDFNASGGTYVYAAFAENPFALNARAR